MGCDSKGSRGVVRRRERNRTVTEKGFSRREAAGVKTAAAMDLVALVNCITVVWIL